MLKIERKTVTNKMGAAGPFREGIHFFRPPGFRDYFKRSAVV
jgi:hypothetical protein